MPLTTVVLTGLGTSLLRNVGGWLENSLKDGAIDKYEWGQLGATILRVTIITVALAYGFNLDALAAAGSALAADFIISKFDKLAVKKK